MDFNRTRWTIGVFATIVWFWGDRLGIPAAAISLAATIVPGLIGHALGTPRTESSERLPPVPTAVDPLFPLPPAPAKPSDDEEPPKP